MVFIFLAIFLFLLKNYIEKNILIHMYFYYIAKNDKSL